MCIEEGVSLLIRPIKPSDAELVRQFVGELGREKGDRHSRVMKRYLPLQSIEHFCASDNDTRVTLLALIQIGETEKVVIGCAMYVLDPPTGFAECTLAVLATYRRCGFGTRLVRRLSEIARGRGIRGFSALASFVDDPLMQVFRKAGYPLEWVRGDGVLFLRIPFTGSPGHSSAAKNGPVDGQGGPGRV